MRAGCLTRLLFGGLFFLLCTTLLTGIFAPWGFYLGGHLHWFPYWHGVAHVRSSSGDFLLRFWITPRPSGGLYHYPAFSGWAWLCTPRGERYRLRVTGGFFERTGYDTNGKAMSLDLYSRPNTWQWTGHWDRRPHLYFTGRWQNPNLVMNDGGTLSRAFLPDGTLAPEKPPQPVVPREKLQIVFQEEPWTAWSSSCPAK